MCSERQVRNPSARPKSEMATIGQHGGRDSATNYFIVGESPRRIREDVTPER
jgi:hypothetical protein